MMVLVSGGAGSGKSACAEDIVLSLGETPRVYLATMQVWSAEDQARVARHRAMRRGRGFLTVERPTDVGGAQLPQGCVVLLEDLTNLTANECFGGDGFAGAEERIFAGIQSLTCQAKDLVIVTGELCSDGMDYPEETARYLDLLFHLNRRLAGAADWVVESAAGIPIVWKEPFK